MKLEAVTFNSNSNHGRSVLFVHGAWHSLTCWERNFQRYFHENGLSSMSFSFRGHGNSEKNFSLRWTRINEYVVDLGNVISQLPSPPVLIGHSMGGFIVQKYLEKYSVPAAVLMAPAPSAGIIKPTLRMLKRHPLVFFKANIQMYPYRLVGSPDLYREYFLLPSTRNDLLKDYFDMLENESYMALIDMMFRLPKKPVTPSPMLVIGGDQDQIFTTNEIENTAAFYGAECKVFSGMPHNMMLDSQWESVADFIIVWLKNQQLVN